VTFGVAAEVIQAGSIRLSCHQVMNPSPSLPTQRSVSPADDVLACPPHKAVRERLRAMAADLVSPWRSTGVPSACRASAGLRKVAETLVERAGASRDIVGWTMVTIVSEYWRGRLMAGGSGRRLLLLPDCPLAEGISAEAMPHVCGPQCSIATLWSAARESGWVVEPTSRALSAIGSLLTGQYDGVLGVARLRDLEKAFKMLPAFSLPVAAVPYEPVTIVPGTSCADAHTAAAIDVEWVLGLLGVAGGDVAPVGDYLPTLREAAEMFTPSSLRDVSSRLGLGDDLHAAAPLVPLAATGGLAAEFLARGGKFLRPFITLAAYDAVAADVRGRDVVQGVEVPRDAIKAAALAIEVFHKASLVHDDIEDDDRMRYGRPTMHREHGVAAAINVGDYLVGLGYRIVSVLPGVDPVTQRDLVALLADAHVRLARGQGAELWWRDAADKRLSPAESLEIYALKTSPAFEAAVAMGIRLAGCIPESVGEIGRYARHVGTGFQVLNDLKDWSGDVENDRRAAGDLLGGRPTLMWALAVERLSPAAVEKLLQEARRASTPDASAGSVAEAIHEARGLYREADVFRRAAEIVADERAKAAAAAASCRFSRLREVLEFLLDLAVPEQAASGIVT
jgi:geranylgeranyl pyrophosphate synthase